MAGVISPVRSGAPARSTTARARRRRGERGIAIAMTALLLIPLMVFAALGVDLAAFYARASELQRAADAAALAGAVWMPNLARATTEATANLRNNGFVDGNDNITITIAQGATASRIRVTVTDDDVDRYFSSVFENGPARLSRYAEGEYNLPLPLGSPLNYFGGDATRTVPPPPPPTQPNPIDATRSPGFWAAIEGPQTRASQGDAYSTRCYGTSSMCTGIQNSLYLDPTNVDRGYWYAIKIPTGLTGSVAINVFDASFIRGGAGVNAGDRGLDCTSSACAPFTTQYQVYRQTNPFDVGQRTALFTGSPDVTEGSCNWGVTNDTAFQGQWRNLCTLTAVAPGQIYLLNVQTTGTTGDGVNGYSLEAVANGGHSGVQPQLYAHNSMEMQNNNLCSPSPCTPPPSTFYLAEVGPQYAGRVLVMELWDPGDVGNGVTAEMRPMRPSATNPRPVVPVPATDCTFTADTAPNGSLSGITGTTYSTPQGSDDATDCVVRVANSGTSRFNGVWLRIRVHVPEDYDCDLGVNPETTANSCWWGIRYQFSGLGSSSTGEVSATDVTTWEARIEGNPLRLTQ